MTANVFFFMSTAGLELEILLAWFVRGLGRWYDVSAKQQKNKACFGTDNLKAQPQLSDQKQILHCSWLLYHH